MKNFNFRSPWSPKPSRHGQEKPKPPKSCHDRFFPDEKPKPRPRPRPKVVSIPIHFVEAVANAKRKDSAAVKIQKLLRGFLVRKKIRIVKAIEAEIGEIEWRVESSKDLIRNNEKERMRVNEALMKLLLRLDSVCGVRDFRRKVILKAISLQDRVDSLVGREIAMADGETLEIPQERAVDEIKLGSLVEETLECPSSRDNGVSWMEEEEAVYYGPGGLPPPESSEGARERMALENKRLKGLVAELSERSALQCSLMGGLAKRVEQLEKTVAAMEERRKKKKKKMEASSALAYEKNKCCCCCHHKKSVQ